MDRIKQLIFEYLLCKPNYKTTVKEIASYIAGKGYEIDPAVVVKILSTMIPEGYVETAPKITSDNGKNSWYVAGRKLINLKK
ncbi:MAG: hypothetical protein ACOX30_07050 [Dethiobacteria bacterium]|jgi:hypothetical protein